MMALYIFVAVLLAPLLLIAPVLACQYWCVPAGSWLSRPVLTTHRARMRVAGGLAASGLLTLMGLEAVWGGGNIPLHVELAAFSLVSWGASLGLAGEFWSAVDGERRPCS